MSGKERLLLFVLLLIGLLLLPFTVKASSEKDIIDAFLQKKELKRPHNLLFPSLSIHYGFVDPSSYNGFVSDVNGAMSPYTTGGMSVLHEIGRVSGFDIGFGVVSHKGMLSFAFTYWLNAGSTVPSDLTFTLGEGQVEVDNFEFRSQISTWGLVADYQFFILNPPKPFTESKRIALRLGGGGGFYKSSWRLWEGFGGVHPQTGEQFVLTEPLKCSKGGFHISGGAETRLWKGLVAALDMKYLWLDFQKFSLRESETYELYLVHNDSQEPVGADFSGLRMALTLKTYFTF
jgi:hypothetical protein